MSDLSHLENLKTLELSLQYSFELKKVPHQLTVLRLSQSKFPSKDFFHNTPKDLKQYLYIDTRSSSFLWLFFPKSNPVFSDYVATVPPVTTNSVRGISLRSQHVKGLENLAGFRQLRTLNLVTLTAIPLRSISNLEHLKKVHLSSPTIDLSQSSQPAQMIYQNLESLDLNFQQGRSIGDTVKPVESWKQMQTIRLPKNIGTIGPENPLPSIPSLRYLKIENSKIVSNPFSKRIPNLEVLVLKNCELISSTRKQVSAHVDSSAEKKNSDDLSPLEWISKLPHLKKLYLIYTDVDDLVGIEKCTDLTHFEFSNTLADSVRTLREPELNSIGKLPRLKWLNLGTHPVEKVPQFAECTELKTLVINLAGHKNFQGLKQWNHLESLHLTQLEMKLNLGTNGQIPNPNRKKLEYGDLALFKTIPNLKTLKSCEKRSQPFHISGRLPDIRIESLQNDGTWNCVIQRQPRIGAYPHSRPSIFPSPTNFDSFRNDFTIDEYWNRNPFVNYRIPCK